MGKRIMVRAKQRVWYVEPNGVMPGTEHGLTYEAGGRLAGGLHIPENTVDCKQDFYIDEDDFSDFDEETFVLVPKMQRVRDKVMQIFKRDGTPVFEEKSCGRGSMRKLDAEGREIAHELTKHVIDTSDASVGIEDTEKAAAPVASTVPAQPEKKRVGRPPKPAPAE